MSIRHVVDESGLRLAEAAPDHVGDVVDAFLDRLHTARERHEIVARSVDLYRAPVTEELDFYGLLYDDESPLDDIDLRRRLRIAVDRLIVWDETEALGLVRELDVVIAGKRFFAPSIAYAHACRRLPRTIGCMLFESNGRKGPVEVLVGEEPHMLHFVVDEADHVRLFRDAVVIENMDEAEFEINAKSAFPNLLWVEGVWRGISAFQRPYLEHRPTLVKHLAVLNDVAAETFAELSATHPEQIAANLGARGVEASDENGRTKRDKEALKDRLRRFEGEDRAFWWHTKLLPHTDRIHFWWRRDDAGGAGEIVVGIFTDHCHLPG